MVELLLKRYLWLIDTLKRNGEMTFDEISEKWDRSSANDNGSELTKRTFYNHCQAIARHFGIDIECRRGRGLNLYYITNPEAIEENVQPSAIACRPYKDSRPDSWAAISVMVSSDREADHGTFQLVCSEAMRRIGR